MTSVLHRLCGRDQAFKGLSELLQAVHQSAEDELLEQAAGLNDEERRKIHITLADTLRQLGSKSAFEIAALLFLFETSAHEHQRGELFKELEKETGIGRTQLYRLIAVYRQFGKWLIAEPQVMGMFVSESLKLLSEASVSDEARETAINLARRGTRITIAIAKKIRRKHSAHPTVPETDSAAKADYKPRPNSKKSSSLTSAGRWLWRFDSSPVTICIGRTKKGQAISADAIVRTLEMALQRARKEFSGEQSTSNNNVA